MCFTSHSPHITCHVTTLLCVVTIMWPLCDQYHTFCDCDVKGVQKGIVYWDKQNNDVPAPNCVLKVWGEIIKVEDL